MNNDVIILYWNRNTAAMRDIDWGYYKDFCMLFHLKECDLSNLECFMNVITYAYGSVL